MTKYLLDVNVLIALFNPRHVHHPIARKWFAEKTGDTWATCPITEAGLIRIMSNPSYGSEYDRPEQIVKHLELTKDKFSNHSFWPDSLPLSDNDIIDFSCVMSWKHLTDAYLLALAYKNEGKLATLDKGITANWLMDKKADVIEFL
ncbi:MAG: PIN domain-containing protein [Phaeodactylibacter sp.]|nr:PIN domain-containing protein [Phaeodactylibacter sp.]